MYSPIKPSTHCCVLRSVVCRAVLCAAQLCAAQCCVPRGVVCRAVLCVTQIFARRLDGGLCVRSLDQRTPTPCSPARCAACPDAPQSSTRMPPPGRRREQPRAPPRRPDWVSPVKRQLSSKPLTSVAPPAQAHVWEWAVIDTNTEKDRASSVDTSPGRTQ